MTITMLRLGLSVVTSVAVASSCVAGIVPVIPRLPAELLPQKPAPEAAPAPKDPASKEEPKADDNDPEKIADRISKNTKTASDKLKEQDPGEDTRKTQEQILKDIDELLKQARNNSNSGGGGGGSSSSSDMSQGMPPMGGSSSSGGGTGGGSSGSSGGSRSGSNSGQPPPMRGQTPQGQGQLGPQPPKRQGWRDREQQEQGLNGTGKKEQAPMPMPQGGPRPDPKKERGERGERGDPQQPASPRNGTQDPKGGTAPGEAGQSKPSLPLDDAITKQVWGHLPEKLRQQMSQYYKEQFMPKYGALLRQYYSNLAEREKTPKK